MFCSKIKKKKDIRQNHTHFCLMQGVNLCEVEISKRKLLVASSAGGMCGALESVCCV